MSDKSAQHDPRMTPKSVQQACPIRVSRKRFFSKASKKSAKQECPTRTFHKSVLQRASFKRVLKRGSCRVRVFYQVCLMFGWLGVLFLFGCYFFACFSVLFLGGCLLFVWPLCFFVICIFLVFVFGCCVGAAYCAFSQMRWILTFGGSLVEHVRFGSLDFHFWRKSPGECSFSKIVEQEFRAQSAKQTVSSRSARQEGRVPSKSVKEKCLPKSVWQECPAKSNR